MERGNDSMMIVLIGTKHYMHSHRVYLGEKAALLDDHLAWDHRGMFQNFVSFLERVVLFFSCEQRHSGKGSYSANCHVMKCKNLAGLWVATLGNSYCGTLWWLEPFTHRTAWALWCQMELNIITEIVGFLNSVHAKWKLDLFTEYLGRWMMDVSWHEYVGLDGHVSWGKYKLLSCDQVGELNENWHTGSWTWRLIWKHWMWNHY